jgi:hypothetical protein
LIQTGHSINGATAYLPSSSASSTGSYVRPSPVGSVRNEAEAIDEQVEFAASMAMGILMAEQGGSISASSANSDHGPNRSTIEDFTASADMLPAANANPLQFILPSNADKSSNEGWHVIEKEQGKLAKGGTTIAEFRGKPETGTQSVFLLVPTFV